MFSSLSGAINILLDSIGMDSEQIPCDFCGKMLRDKSAIHHHREYCKNYKKYKEENERIRPILIKWIKDGEPATIELGVSKARAVQPAEEPQEKASPIIFLPTITAIETAQASEKVVAPERPFGDIDAIESEVKNIYGVIKLIREDMSEVRKMVNSSRAQAGKSIIAPAASSSVETIQIATNVQSLIKDVAEIRGVLRKISEALEIYPVENIRQKKVDEEKGEEKPELMY
jgi:predicted transcriptional regulator